nr:MAG TPA: hypothetical protein [Caudoviricetes sp.]
MMAGMDSQFIANLISGISALATVIAAIYTRRQAIGSKEAKAEAEERARHAEELLKQMQQIVTEQQSQSQSQADIASNLWRPKFQLTHVRGLRYKLQNITKQSLNVLKVVNQDEFFRCDNIHQQFSPGESLDIRLGGAWGIPLPSNLILQIAGQNEPIHVQIPGESD